MDIEYEMPWELILFFSIAGVFFTNWLSGISLSVRSNIKKYILVITLPMILICLLHSMAKLHYIRGEISAKRVRTLEGNVTSVDHFNSKENFSISGATFEITPFDTYCYDRTREVKTSDHLIIRYVDMSDFLLSQHDCILKLSKITKGGKKH